MVKRLVWTWVIIFLTLTAVTTGQPTNALHPINSPCFNLALSLCSCPPLGTDFVVFHPICKIAEELVHADRLLKTGKRLAQDALRIFSYEPSLRDSLHRLVAALNKFSKQVDQLKRHATRVCPTLYIR